MCVGTYDAFDRFLQRTEGLEPDADDHAKGCFVYNDATPDNKRHNYIWFKGPTSHTIETYSVIAHECVHATAATLKYAGVKPTDASEELYAYYTEWLFREIALKLHAKRDTGRHRRRGK